MVKETQTVCSPFVLSCNKLIISNALSPCADFNTTIEESKTKFFLKETRAIWRAQVALWTVIFEAPVLTSGEGAVNFI